MEISGTDILAAAIVAIVVFLSLCAALLLTAMSARRPRAAPLLAAGSLVTLCLILVAVLPWNVPPLWGAVLALLVVALATVGGNPVVRWVLAVADGGGTHDGPRGGILVERAEASDPSPVALPGQQVEILRGGTTIGYLERLAAALSIIAGFPAAIAVIVALKGIGRFAELSTPAARERFIVGTLASLLWACVAGGVAYLAIW